MEVQWPEQVAAVDAATTIALADMLINKNICRDIMLVSAQINYCFAEQNSACSGLKEVLYVRIICCRVKPPVDNHIITVNAIPNIFISTVLSCTLLQ